MSFGWGPASEMNKTVQKLRRPRQETLKKVGKLIQDDGIKITDKKATPEQLAEIRKKLNKENQKALFIKIIFFSVLGAAFFYFI